MIRIAAIGGTGMIASRVLNLLRKEFDFVPLDETTVDITDYKSLKGYFDTHEFKTVINFAAYTNVDGAEKERGDQDGLTWKLNVCGVQNLIDVCKEKQIFFVQISTDFVFTGSEKNPGPYSEDSLIPQELTSDLSWYGWTKNRAENIISNSSIKNAIIRIAYPFYSSNFDGKLDFAKTYLKLYDEAKLYPLFTDQRMSFLNVDFLAIALCTILEKKLEGIFHIVSKNTGSPFEFVEYLLKEARGVKAVVQKGSIKEFLKDPSRTPRPAFGGLRTEMSQKRLGIKFKTWQEMLDDFVEKYDK